MHGSLGELALPGLCMGRLHFGHTFWVPLCGFKAAVFKGKRWRGQGVFGFEPILKLFMVLGMEESDSKGMTVHVEKERWRVCKARLRRALAGAVGAVVLLAVFRFVEAHFFWHVEAMLLPPLREWPEELQRQAAAFRETRGDLKARQQIRIRDVFFFGWYDDGKVSFRVSEERVGYWDVLFRKRPVWTMEDVLAAFGPYDTMIYWDDWKVHWGYDCIWGYDGQKWDEPGQTIFLFDHGVLTGVGSGRVY